MIQFMNFQVIVNCTRKVTSHFKICAAFYLVNFLDSFSRTWGFFYLLFLLVVVMHCLVVKYSRCQQSRGSGFNWRAKLISKTSGKNLQWVLEIHLTRCNYQHEDVGSSNQVICYNYSYLFVLQLFQLLDFIRFSYFLHALQYSTCKWKDQSLLLNNKLDMGWLTVTFRYFSPRKIVEYSSLIVHLWIEGYTAVW